MTQNPVAVLDSSQDWPPPNLDEVQNWVRSQGVEPKHTYRVEVYLVDTLFARVFQYARDEQGHRYCGVDHDHRNDLDGCEIAKREPYTVLVSSLPPQIPGTPQEPTP